MFISHTLRRLNLATNGFITRDINPIP